MTKNVVKATAGLLLINVCVKLLSFVREMVIANGFGASSASDAYLVAFTFPNFFQAILGYAFVSAALPAITENWQRPGGEERAFRLGSNLLNATATLAAALVVLGIIFSRGLVFLCAPNFSPETSALAVRLTRIVLPSLLFAALAMMMTAVLNSRYRFAAAALAPGLASLGIILSCLLTANITVVAIGTSLGYLACLLLVAHDLPRCGFRYRPHLDWRDPELSRVLKDMLPILLGLAVTQCYTIVNRIFASGMNEGSISALNYANKVMMLPISLFVVAVITAVFPRLVEEAHSGQTKELAASLSRALSFILMLTLPSTAGLLLLDKPIIRLLFERGSFNAHDTLVTAQALTAQAPGLIFLACSMLLLRVFYAYGDPWTPLKMGLISIGVNVLVSLVLMRPLGHVGLAWANSLAAAVNCALLARLLHKRMHFIDGYLIRSLREAFIATLVMCPVLVLLSHLTAASGPLIQALGSILAGIAVYFLLLLILRSPMLFDSAKELRRR